MSRFGGQLSADDLINSHYSKNTKKTDKLCKEMLMKYLFVNNVDLHESDNSTLDNTLSVFFLLFLYKQMVKMLNPGTLTQLSTVL